MIFFLENLVLKVFKKSKKKVVKKLDGWWVMGYNFGKLKD
jgi:hypothetical protein